MPENNIQETINQLIRKLDKPVSVFLNGKCLLFARGLKKLIGGTMEYLTEEAHVVLRIGIRRYDATGNVTKRYRDSNYLSESEFLNRKKLVLALEKDTKQEKSAIS